MKMVKMNIYLNFMDNTEEAFNFYRSVFGGEFTMVQRFKDTPEASKVSAADQEKLMHIALPVGSNLLMGSDAPESMGFKIVQGDNFSISLDVDSITEADQIFEKLSEGGKVEMKLQNMFWGTYFGMLRDKFGIRWMINYVERKES
jgi:PhnB protein